MCTPSCVADYCGSDGCGDTCGCAGGLKCIGEHCGCANSEVREGNECIAANDYCSNTAPCFPKAEVSVDLDDGTTWYSDVTHSLGYTGGPGLGVCEESASYFEASAFVIYGEPYVLDGGCGIVYSAALSIDCPLLRSHPTGPGSYEVVACNLSIRNGSGATIPAADTGDWEWRDNAPCVVEVTEYDHRVGGSLAGSITCGASDSSNSYGVSVNQVTASFRYQVVAPQ